MKEIEVFETKGDRVTICPACKKIKDAVTVYLSVFLLTSNADMTKIPFQPVEQCTCEETHP
jgi:hypothetical protein